MRRHSSPRLALDEKAARAASRVTAIRLAVLVSRCMELWRGNRRDSVTALIILAVIAITSEKFTRLALEGDRRTLDTYLPLEALQSCNVASIAAATGLNRETARRRVRNLIEEGLLIRTKSGEIALSPDRVNQPEALELVRKQLDAVLRFTNAALRDGVFTLR